MDSKFNMDGNYMKNIILMCLATLILTACSSIPNIPTNFVQNNIETEYFSFFILEKNTIQKDKPLRLYIEGDGNPNPKVPVAYYLAQKDTSPNVIYIGRPCQFLDSQVCKNKQIYTTARFHPEVIKEITTLLKLLMKRHKIPTVEIVGYGGGATVSLLLASRVPTVRVVTIAGILDTKSQVGLHEDTLNPFEIKDLLSKIKQTHYVGGKDKIAPRRIAERFVGLLNYPVSATVKVLPNMTHTGWEHLNIDWFE